MTFTETEALTFLSQRPSVHQLCAGAHLQAPFRVGLDVLAVPLEPLGYLPQATHLARFVNEVLQAPIDQASFARLAASGHTALPIIVLTAPMTLDAAPADLETLAVTRLEQARQVLAWATGDSLWPFGMVVCSSTDSHYRLILPHSRRRQRLFGLGGSAGDFQETLSRIKTAADTDQRFAFALALHHDAVREPNPHFRIGRLFNVLECLAYRLKSSALPSRKAVKYLLGIEAAPDTVLEWEGRPYRIDTVEIAGRVRDKIFHGTPFEAADLTVESRPAFDIYERDPTFIADSLAARCEMEIARWANGVSRGLAPPSQEAV